MSLGYLDPLRTADAIRGAYERYLLSTAGLRDDALREKYAALLSEEATLVRGPLLEATPPYRKGASIADLVNETILDRRFHEMNPNALNPDRPLYKHQERAVRHVLVGNRNLVAATGTGSGKTETFLIPIIDQLLRDAKAKTLTPGVRALLLYPMNALAHDQLRRLRGLLAPFPEITFGRYVGDTDQTLAKANESFRSLFPGEPRLPNEWISREQMQREPPHILLTNFAMLEYLLIRPTDSELFRPVNGRSTWRFLVLDEAHTYDGALGVEVAMLLRRLKDRVAESRPGRLRCIATSATIGGESKAAEVARFATNLFGEDFDAQDIVFAERVPASENADDVLGEGNPDLYASLVAALDRGGAAAVEEIKAVVRRQVSLGSDWLAEWEREHTGIETPAESAGGRAAARPSKDDDWGIEASLNAPDGGAESGTPESEDAALRLLHGLLRFDGRLQRLREYVEGGSSRIGGVVGLRQAADEIFPELPDREHRGRAITHLVQLGVRARAAREDTPLLPARYHLFLRATTGARVCLMDHVPSTQHPRGGWRLSLETRETCDLCGPEVRMFELASCGRCGQAFLTGEVEELDGGRVRLGLTPTAIVDRKPTATILLEEEAECPDDEDEIVSASGETAEFGESEEPEAKPAKKKKRVENRRLSAALLCRRCGNLRDESGGRACKCEERHSLRVTRLPKGTPKTCPRCAARSPRGIVQSLLTGRDAAPAVIATALFPQIPAQSSPQLRNTPGQGRKLLGFADSRQDAAYFAPYLEESYERMLYRRLALKLLRGLRGAADGDIGIEDLIDPVAREVESIRANVPDESRHQMRSRAARWLTVDLIGLDARHSLEALGLLAYRVHFGAEFQIPRGMSKVLGLSDADARGLIEFFLDSLRKQGAVTYAEGVDITDVAFEPRNREVFVRQADSDPIRKILAFVPGETGGQSNGRLDFLQRLLMARGVDERAAKSQAREALTGIWEFLTSSSASTGARLFDAVSLDDRGGRRFRVNHRALRLVPTRSGDFWFQCDTCQRLTPRNIAGLCPQYRCKGALLKIQPIDDARLSTDHYRVLYESMPLLGLRAEEHTAQLVREEATKTQSAFIRGESNFLSCSTTFELGVDVGELEAVLIRNVPPKPSNYVQRAGRAGRRASGAALVVTYAQRRPHDLYYFQDPGRMIRGEIRPPVIEISNRHIVARHVHSTVLAEYFRSDPSAFCKVGEFFEGETSDAVPPVVRVESWVRAHAAELRSILQRVVPATLRAEIGVADGSWAAQLFDPAIRGSLARAAARVRGDLHDYRTLQNTALADKKGKLADRYARILSTYMQRDLLGELGRHLVLPAYTFPTDAVSLELHSDEALGKVELTRDLSLAISEYAPGSEVVARKRLWRSDGLRLEKGRSLERFRYAYCTCGWFTPPRKDGEIFDPPRACPHCKATVRIGTSPFVRPEFGFYSLSDQPKRPGQSRPSRMFATQIFFSGLDREEPPAKKLVDPSGKPVVSVLTATDGRLVLLNEGVGRMGFRFCSSCGYAQPVDPSARASGPSGPGGSRTHPAPWGRDCGGRMEPIVLGHYYLTDVAVMRFEARQRAPEIDARAENNTWWSVSDALLQGAADALDIPREELNSTLHQDGGRTSIVFFDAVPGGAGYARAVFENPSQVLEAALERTLDCECDPKSACYACLKSFRNQFRHAALHRGAAARFLLDALCAHSGTSPVESRVRDISRFVRHSVLGAKAARLRISRRDSDSEASRSFLSRLDKELGESDSFLVEIPEGSIAWNEWIRLGRKAQPALPQERTSISFELDPPRKLLTAHWDIAGSTQSLTRVTVSIS